MVDSSDFEKAHATMSAMIRLLLPIMVLSGSLFAGEFPFPVHNPSDSSPSKQAEELVPYVHPQVKSLLEHFSKPRDSDFISESQGKPDLKWRVDRATILSSNLVAIDFTEGHIQVFGIFLRNDKEKRWDLHSEVYGKFRERSFAD